MKRSFGVVLILLSAMNLGAQDFSSVYETAVLYPQSGGLLGPVYVNGAGEAWAENSPILAELLGAYPASAEAYDAYLIERRRSALFLYPGLALFAAGAAYWVTVLMETTDWSTLTPDAWGISAAVAAGAGFILEYVGVLLQSRAADTLNRAVWLYNREILRGSILSRE